MSTLLITDSRGSGIQDHLTSLGHINTNTLVHRGAGFELSVLKSVTEIKHTRPHLIVILAGVCDLTRRDRTLKTTHLRHNTVNENVNHVIGSAKSALDLIKALGNHRVTLATITGIDLADYNNPERSNMTADEYRYYCQNTKVMHTQQDILNTSVLEINRQITALNRSNSVPTIWTGGVVHTHSKRKTHHHYIRLFDGCHADSQTKKEWANQIHKALKRIATLIPKCPQLTLYA